MKLGPSILFPELRNDEEKFFSYLRMSITSFDQLHNLLKGHLQRKNTRLTNAVSGRLDA